MIPTVRDIVCSKESVLDNNGVVVVHENKKAALIRRGCRYHTVHPRHPHQGPEQDDETRLPSFRIDRSGRRYAYPAQLGPLDIESLVKRIFPFDIDEIVARADVAEANGPHSAGELLFRAAARQDTPTSLFIHINDGKYMDDYTRWYLRPLLPIFKEAQRKRCHRMAMQADIVVAPSRHAEAYFRDWARYDGDIKVAPSYIQPFDLLDEAAQRRFSDQFRAQLPTSLINFDAYPMFLFVGRISKVKNCEFVVRAFTELVRQHHHNHIEGVSAPILVMVGDTSEQRYVRHLLNLADNLQIGHLIFFPGHLDHDVVLKLMQCSTAFLFPSMSETQGLVNHEALYGRTPSLVPFDSPMIELIPKRYHELLGLPINDYEAWAITCNQLMCNRPLRLQVGADCHLAAKPYTDQGAYADQLLDTYREAIDRHRRRIVITPGLTLPATT